MLALFEKKISSCGRDVSDVLPLVPFHLFVLNLLIYFFKILKFVKKNCMPDNVHTAEDILVNSALSISASFVSAVLLES